MAERKKLLLRLDPHVYEAIARWAADDIRSVNAQIEYALRLALRSAGRPPKPARAGSPAGPPADPDNRDPDGRQPESTPDGGGPERAEADGWGPGRIGAGGGESGGSGSA
ncbi:hypothetical protein GCM10022225_34780 [Plantactinospora mayteni]|uniref:Toxin-antitoxin system HicB family antitoxin n=1 Tax=Plantactinospora mayteni TaxID=566021 RepID=A0ABQ4EMN5_9ACTN|nr:hypothetical protein [Plantactinospora mayteni]GIG95913.1 hypothetical protein Pma05_24860 [Plantactinospora mayteni]